MVSMRPADASFLQTIAAALRHLMAQPGIATSACMVEYAAPAPFAEERELVARSVHKRQQEFSAGRHAAHAALLTLGAEPGPLLCDADRVPLWPTGFTGSVSHCARVAIAAVARTNAISSIGVDVETDAALPKDVADMVCTERENALCRPWNALIGFDACKFVFSAKEAWYKADYPKSRRFREFKDVEVVRLDARGAFEIREIPKCGVSVESAPLSTGRFVRVDDHVVCSVVLPPEFRLPPESRKNSVMALRSPNIA